VPDLSIEEDFALSKTIVFLLMMIFALLSLVFCDKSTDPRVIEDPFAGLDGSGGGVLVYSVVSTDGDHDLHAVNADGSNPMRLILHQGMDIEPDCSPSGKKVAFSSLGEDRSQSSIFVMSFNAINLDRLTNTRNALDENPAWSPDGRKIAFERVYPLKGYSSEVWVMNSDGSFAAPLTEGGFPSWSPDGEWIVFESYRDGNSEIYSIRADGSEPKRLTNNDAYDWGPSWSPDGQRIAFTSDLEGNLDIYLMNPDGSGLVQITTYSGYDAMPSWSPDGKRICFVSTREGKSELFTMNSEGSDAVRITQTETNVMDPVWRPDIPAKQ
jgi:Tol biopolymer transport system component